MNSYWISSPIIFSLKGPDSERYLQARLSQDLRGDFCGAKKAAALNPQGKVEGYFAVIKLADNKFLLEVLGSAEAQKVQEALLRYKVADRVKLEHLLDHKLLHLYGQPNFVNQLKAEFPALIFIKLSRSELEGVDIIGSSEQINALSAHPLIRDLKQLSDHEAEFLRLKGQIPYYSSELRDSFQFSESNLSEAVSFSKGCYVGQEVVEKIDAYGKAAFSLRAFKASSDSIEPGADVVLEGGSVGQVLSYSNKNDEGYGFVRIRDKFSDSDKLSASEATLQILK